MTHVTWTKHRWETTLDVDAMLAEARRRGVPRNLLAAALASCVRLCLSALPAHETRHRDALALVEAVARRTAQTNLSDLYRVIQFADSLAADGNNNWYVGEATKNLAMFLYDGLTPPIACVTAAARSVVNAPVLVVLHDFPATVVNPAYEAALAEALRRMATILREHLPWAQLVAAEAADE